MLPGQGFGPMINMNLFCEPPKDAVPSESIVTHGISHEMRVFSDLLRVAGEGFGVPPVYDL